MLVIMLPNPEAIASKLPTTPSPQEIPIYALAIINATMGLSLGIRINPIIMIIETARFTTRSVVLIINPPTLL